MIPASDRKNQKNSRGQIFTLDVLAALLGVTIMLGVTIQYQTLLKDQTTETRYTEMKTMAEDASQIAVKRIINEEHRVNTVSTGAESDLENFLEGFTGDRYGYEVSGPINRGNCGNREQVNSRRIVDNNGEPETLVITICTN